MSISAEPRGASGAALRRRGTHVQRFLFNALTLEYLPGKGSVVLGRSRCGTAMLRKRCERRAGRDDEGFDGARQSAGRSGPGSGSLPFRSGTGVSCWRSPASTCVAVERRPTFFSLASFGATPSIEPINSG